LLEHKIVRVAGFGLLLAIVMWPVVTGSPEHYPPGNRLFAVASSYLACAYEEIGNGK
jgi:hypothetical protein